MRPRRRPLTITLTPLFADAQQRAHEAACSLGPIVPAEQTGATPRGREMAVLHLLFGTIRIPAERRPEPLDEQEGSVGHIWDKADDVSRDDEAVRDIIPTVIKSVLAETLASSASDAE